MISNTIPITPEILKTHLSYDPETGIFTRRKKVPGRNGSVGDVAGTRTNRGIKVTLLGLPYNAHRLAWLHVHGELPAEYITHKNGDIYDNRIANLQIGSRRELRAIDRSVVTHDILRDLLLYAPETGAFTWRDHGDPGNCRLGGRAGHDGNSGYGHRHIKIYGRAYKEHRLAWLYVHGEWPTGEIDHIDGNPANNRIANLRCATKSQNQGNRKVGRDNTSGFKGVSNRGGRYIARIAFEGKSMHLGCFATASEAHRAYCEKAEQLRGEFARFR